MALKEHEINNYKKIIDDMKKENIVEKLYKEKIADFNKLKSKFTSISSLLKTDD